MLFIKILIVLLIICLILILYFKHKSTNHFTVKYKKEQCIATDYCNEGEHCCFFKGSPKLDLTELAEAPATAEEAVSDKAEEEAVSDTAVEEEEEEAIPPSTSAVAGPLEAPPNGWV